MNDALFPGLLSPAIAVMIWRRSGDMHGLLKAGKTTKAKSMTHL
jgi:hypothetical protein